MKINSFMKNYLSRILLITLIIMSSASCSKDKEFEIPASNVISGVTTDLNVVADSPVDSVDLIKQYETLLQDLTENNDEDDQEMIEQVQKELDDLREYVDSLVIASGANSGEDGAGDKNMFVGYKYTTIRYQSIDENNMPITLSALVVWPHNEILGKVFGEPDADGLVIGCHVTITDDKERPTNYAANDWKTDVGMLAMAAKSRGIFGGWGSAFENLVVIPDYQGYGASKDRIHPYLYQDLTARQVVDGALAGIQYYEKKHDFEDDWKTITMGYSQGGSVAMAVHRYIEQNNLVKQFRFKGSLCGDGPYDPLATVKRYVKDDKIYMPVAVGLILKGMVDANPYIRGRYKAEDFFTQEFLDTEILDMISSKIMNTDAIQKALLEYSAKYNESDGKFRMYRKSSQGFVAYTKNNMTDENGNKRDWKGGEASAYAKATDILRPELIAWIKGEEVPEHAKKLAAFEKALEMNNLTKGWVPKQWMVLMHSSNDEVVPIENYVSAERAFLDKGSFYSYRWDGESKAQHVPFGKVFYISFTDPLSRWLFDGAYKESDSRILLNLGVASIVV